MLGSYTPKSFDEDTIDSNEPEVGKFVRHPDLIEKAKVQKTKKDPFKKAKEHYEKLKLEKLQKQQELEKSKQEKAQKLQEYKKKKQERFKKLSKKTKKGQPVMTGRLELLLEKIQK
ncbi:PREDICTED: thyroid transcription factor 1-associated protein 26 [Papilio polytes]|uniref:thyroid transcription factor 1-associated protein 26 n=1 Tax=Papilio polytes TaxID=76194 RepID=UPI0006766901|nr:PREDICTED: thyroid transcription factor 1-associated protein 26 [Papilio polytes]